MKTSTYITHLCGLALLLGNIIFFLGYFPMKKSVPRLPHNDDSTFQLDLKCLDTNLTNDESISKNCNVKPLYDRLVFVVIDAMRKDFILSSRSKHNTKVDRAMALFKKENLKFINELLKSKETITFVSHVRPPTVTLSGIKTLTTGTVSAFVDVISNFGSGALSDDNLLERLKSEGKKKILFYGDETWLKLFPNVFDESEGTSSFFVNDYTEVDSNVTRHLERVMKRRDWDCLFLHYLGLDHIGHLSGPSSLVVGPKLEEMDRVVQYLKLGVDEKDRAENRRTLLLLTSDHGMTDDGNHGGSSDDELSTPLVLVGSTFKHSKHSQGSEGRVNQVDIVPTLSLLLGTSIPSNNVGVVMPTTFLSSGVMETLKALRINGGQLFQLLKRDDDNFEENKFYKMFQEASKRHSNLLQNTPSSYSSSSSSPASPSSSLPPPSPPPPSSSPSPSNETEALDIMSHYKRALDGLSEELVFSLSKYDTATLWMALICNGLCTIALILRLIHPDDDDMKERYRTKISALVSSTCAGLYLLVVVVSPSDHPEVGGLVVVAKVVMMTISVFAFSAEFLKNASQFDVVMDYVERSMSNPYTIFMIIIITMNCLSMLSSSFIEEEQNVHHFVVVTFLIVIIIITMGETSQDRRMVSSNHRTDKDHMTRKVKVVMSSVMLLLMCRMAKSWNQTGDKWKHLEDVGDWLNRPENHAWLLLVVIISITSIFIVELVRHKHNNLIGLLLACGFVSSLVHQLNSGPISSHLFGTVTPNEEMRITTARISLGASFAIFVVSISKRLRATNMKMNGNDSMRHEMVMMMMMVTDVRTSLVVATLTLCRPHNSFLVLVNYAAASLLRQVFNRSSSSPVSSSSPSSSSSSPVSSSSPSSSSPVSSPVSSSSSSSLVGPNNVAIFYFWMGQTFFYYQGNSNNLTTIDFAVGNSGQRSYSFVMATGLTFLHTHSSTIFWLLSLTIQLLSKSSSSPPLSSSSPSSPSSPPPSTSTFSEASDSYITTGNDSYHLLGGDDDDGSHDDDDLRIPDKKSSRKSGIYEASLAILTLHSLTSTFYLLVMIMMRYHLFVWSVFSPKFLYVVVVQFLLTGFATFCRILI